MIDLVIWSFVMALAPVAVGLAWKGISGVLGWIELGLLGAFGGAGPASSPVLTLRPGQSGLHSPARAGGLHPSWQASGEP